ncbi:hypothetical protein NX868_08970 [Burkholderia thailandensis]|uniref:hypothetical protein n=1 Tax=Burkholderia thailandensis TaxID=57975 RepID=UPI00217D6BC4|nr:hypothetical protein [Burkholderia thailandensis]MCS6456832.1 hypothetical protein [Burkholderia thailandensis]MCS6482406.1 hypothetical protein [Burkholderia thailandensis]MCS6492435.1 hypothetical protein [Burkholderia thailandensis]
MILDRSVVVFGFNRTRHEVVMPAAHWPACDGLRQCALRLAARPFDATLRFCVALLHAGERFAFRDSGRDLISREAPWRARHALGRQLQAGAADAVRMRVTAQFRARPAPFRAGRVARKAAGESEALHVGASVAVKRGLRGRRSD